MLIEMVALEPQDKVMRVVTQQELRVCLQVQEAAVLQGLAHLTPILTAALVVLQQALTLLGHLQQVVE